MPDQVLPRPCEHRLLHKRQPASATRYTLPRAAGEQQLGCLHAFGASYARRWADARPDVLQREAFSLGPFLPRWRDGRVPNTTYVWAADYERGARNARAGTLLLAGFAPPASPELASLRARHAGIDGLREASIELQVAGARITAVVFVRTR